MSEEGARRFFHFHKSPDAAASAEGDADYADDDMSDEERLPRCPVCNAEIHFMRYARSTGTYSGESRGGFTPRRIGLYSV